MYKIKRGGHKRPPLGHKSLACRLGRRWTVATGDQRPRNAGLVRERAWVAPKPGSHKSTTSYSAKNPAVAGFPAVRYRRRGKEGKQMEKDTKKRTAVWLRPSILKRIDSNLEKDNSNTRSEYIENAVKFYSGYLESDTASDYLCDVLSAMLKGILGNQNDRLRSLLFKWAHGLPCDLGTLRR